MSSDPAVQQSRATPTDHVHVLWSVLRAVAFGLAAAVAGAGLYAAIVILTGYEVGLVAMALGAGVGLAVMVGHAQIADGWVRALSALLTLFSLLLSSYLLIRLYDGEGFAPVPVSVGEAATILREFLGENPSELLFWGLALLTAFGIGTGDDPEVDEEEPDHHDRVEGGTDTPGQRRIGTMSGDNAAPSSVTGAADTPETLVERPRVRLFWFAFFLAFAGGGVVVGIAARDDLGVGWALALVAVSLGFALVGVACLRLSIVADESGLTVTNLFRRHMVPWTDLEDVRLEKVEAEVDLGLHSLVFVTRAGRRIRAEAPTGRIRPGGKMARLQRVLLGMRNRYAPWTTPRDVRPE